MRIWLRLGLALGLTAVAGCSRATQNAAGTPSDQVVVQVRNDAFWDATIYLVREASTRTRLGIATGNATTNLSVSRATMSNMAQVQFIVDWIGRPDRELSDPITAVPGDTIVLQIR